jgi:zinc protease
MKPKLLAGLCSVVAAAACARGADLSAFENIEIAHRRYVLKNGLTLIVHEDRKAPIVAVNIWYHVGSKNERPGRTGFAHLFEHLMFNGSENFNDDFFKVIERIGGTDVNGTTNEDRTNYFENVPKNALDLVLWLESDRMGHFKGAITQARLDEQRGVVQNEKRQSENQPYGRAWELIAKATYPAAHPYSWTVIGSMEDLNAASLEDVKEWFGTYYGPANAVIVLAGDIDFETAKEKVETYFGHIPPGPPLARFESWVAKRTGSQRQTLHDRVPQARLYKVWNAPPANAEQTEYLSLLGDVLTAGKTSRLYHRLVYKDQVASSVSASVDDREIGSQFLLQITARPGQDLGQVERVAEEELNRLLQEGPTAEEVGRVQSLRLARFVRGIERIGGFGGKSDILASSEVLCGTAEFYKQQLAWARGATPEKLRAAAREWLGDGAYTLEVHPFPEFKAGAAQADRSKMPEPEATPDAAFPGLQRAELANGLKIVLAERHGVPMVDMGLVVAAGHSVDPAGREGLSNLTMDMLDEGTSSRDALAISEELQLLGASLTLRSDIDTCVARMSALKPNLERSLALFADVVTDPAFPESEFKRVQKLQLDAIQREKVTPTAMALRVLPGLLFGREHPYGGPGTGSGTEAAVAKLTRADVVTYHKERFRPNNATLVVVGDTALAELRPKLEGLFGRWQRGEVVARPVPEVAPRSDSAVYLVDRPGSIQSVIIAGSLVVPKRNAEEIAIECMNNILGGQFTSRLNMNLRGDKHWAYGAGSFIEDTRGQRYLGAYAPVQSDKTKEAIGELRKEFAGIVGAIPIRQEEVDRVRQQMILEMAGRWETLRAVGSSVAEIVVFGLPEAHYATYAERVRKLTLEQVAKAATTVVQPEQFVWVVVGDRSKIEPGLRELGFNQVRLLDADGRLLN